jgi:hypothetical protein
VRQLSLKLCPCVGVWWCHECRPEMYAGLVQCDACGLWLHPGNLCTRWCRATAAGLIPRWESPDTHYELLRPGSKEFDRVFGPGGELDQLEGRVAA